MKEIKGIARVKFIPGKLEKWKRLTEMKRAAMLQSCSSARLMAENA
jgi:hypothetical protein